VSRVQVRDPGGNKGSVHRGARLLIGREARQKIRSGSTVHGREPYSIRSRSRIKKIRAVHADNDFLLRWG